MGTRSLTVFEYEDGREIAVMYRHFDGYPEGHGQELADFLAAREVTNGIRAGRTANGADCLAAQIVHHFKADSAVGGIYLHAAGTRDIGEEWVYTVRPDERGVIVLKVDAGCVTAFGAPGTKQESMLTLFEGDPAKFDADKIGKAYEAAEAPPADALEQALAKDGE